MSTNTLYTIVDREQFTKRDRNIATRNNGYPWFPKIKLEYSRGSFCYMGARYCNVLLLELRQTESYYSFNVLLLNNFWYVFIWPCVVQLLLNFTIFYWTFYYCRTYIDNKFCNLLLYYLKWLILWNIRLTNK